MSGIANSRQISLERRSPSYWRVTFDHPPLNMLPDIGDDEISTPRTQPRESW
jgi:hypothetical protein